MWAPTYQPELYHHGVKGMKWGVRKDPKKAVGGRKARKTNALITAIKSYIMRANKNGRLIPSYAQAGKTHLQHFQDFMQMTTQQALNDMQMHIDTVNMHNQIHMDMNTNFMNNVDTFNAINSFYMY